MLVWSGWIEWKNTGNHLIKNFVEVPSLLESLFTGAVAHQSHVSDSLGGFRSKKNSQWSGGSPCKQTSEHGPIPHRSTPGCTSEVLMPCECSVSLFRHFPEGWGGGVGYGGWRSTVVNPLLFPVCLHLSRVDSCYFCLDVAAGACGLRAGRWSIHPHVSTLPPSLPPKISEKTTRKKNPGD